MPIGPVVACILRGMATLTENDLVDVTSWDQMRARPRFVAEVDPEKTKLTNIIAQYKMQPMQPCCIKSCHKAHNDGYLVVTADESETFIGVDCGKKHFPDGFSEFKSAFRRRRDEADRQARFSQHVQALPQYHARLDELKSQPLGGRWLLSSLKSLQRACPSPLWNDLRERAKRGDGAIYKEVRRSAEEIEELRERGERGNLLVERTLVTDIDALSVLADRFHPRVVFVDNIEHVLDRLEQEHRTPTGKLISLLRDADRLEANFSEAVAALRFGEAFFQLPNLRKLLQLRSASADPNQTVLDVAFDVAAGEVGMTILRRPGR